MLKHMQANIQVNTQYLDGNKHRVMKLLMEDLIKKHPTYIYKGRKKMVIDDNDVQ